VVSSSIVADERNTMHVLLPLARAHATILLCSITLAPGTDVPIFHCTGVFIR